MKKHLEQERVDNRKYENRPGLGCEGLETESSWVRIVNGINIYVTETSETISLENAEHRATGRLVAKARPRLKPGVTLSSMFIPLRERKWIDVNPERFRQDCFVVSKATIQLLRHDQSVPRR